jgi:hypothetical protein
MPHVSETRLVLQHVTHVEHLNNLHCYHHQCPLQGLQYRDVQHFHLHDLNCLKTPEPAYLISAQP